MDIAPESVKPVLAARARLGEGPCWNAETERLYWVDIYNHWVHEFDPATGHDRWFDVGEVVGCLAPASGDRLIMALQSRLAFLELQSGLVTPILSVPSQPNVRFNDGKCDTAGRFWFGSMCSTGAKGCLYRYDPDGSLHQLESGLTISNGLGWSPDDRTFYLTDSPLKRIYAYDFDRLTGELENRRVLIDLQAEAFFPDGLTIDQEGCLWSAMWDGWCVIRFDPTGQAMLRLPMPIQRPTCCAFGGADLATLYITSASVGLSEVEIRASYHSGDLFALPTTTKGFAANLFRGSADHPS